MPNTVNKRFVDSLPAIFQEPFQPDDERTLPEEPLDQPDETPFVEVFLRAFERVLLGTSDDRGSRKKTTVDDIGDEYEVEGLKEKIAKLHMLFDPNRAPEEFLPWLASWTAFTLRADLSSPRKRRLIARIIPLYSIRGTRKYAEELLKLHLEAMPVVTDFELPGFQVGVHSMVGDDTCLGGGPPHFFRVILVAPLLSESQLESQRQMARSVLELAKPAHTYFELEIASPHLEVGVSSRLGLDTVLSPTAG